MKFFNISLANGFMHTAPDTGICIFISLMSS